MKKAIAIVMMGLLAWAATAAADNIDLIAQPVYINASGGGGGGGGGYADISTNVRILNFGSGASFSTDVALELDGIVYSSWPVALVPYQTPGCTYTTVNGTPTCVADPGCDEMLTDTGQTIPGYCYYAGTQYVPFRCGCVHDYSVLWPHVPIAGVNVLRVIIDGANTVAELAEDNNVTVLGAPVGIEAATWGVIKSLYK